MHNEAGKNPDVLKSLKILSTVNSVIWILAIIALVIMMSRHPGVKGMFPILAGGLAVGVYMGSVIGRLK